MKVVLDTNVLIGFFRNPGQREEFEARSQRPLVLMSSVVALELFAGCRTPLQQKALVNFLKPFEKAGRVLAALGRDGMGTAHRRSIVNDVLIAVSAARAGAIVLTANASDFSLIEKHTHVRWTQFPR